MIWKKNVFFTNLSTFPNEWKVNFPREKKKKTLPMFVFSEFILLFTFKWSPLVPCFVDIAGPLFDANPGQMDEYYKLLYWLDEAQHENATDMALCFKHYTGNKAVVPLLWAAERQNALKFGKKCIF